MGMTLEQAQKILANAKLKAQELRNQHDSYRSEAEADLEREKHQCQQ